jgi:transcriptional regulator with XRE-family HTH domain
VLSPTELRQADRGLELKAYVRAAAALRGIYTDADLAGAVHVTPGAVRGWWSGAMPKNDTLGDIAEATALSLDELIRFVYFDGPAPTLPDLAADTADRLEQGASPSERRRSDRRGTTAG